LELKRGLWRRLKEEAACNNRPAPGIDDVPFKDVASQKKRDAEVTFLEQRVDTVLHATADMLAKIDEAVRKKEKPLFLMTAKLPTEPGYLTAEKRAQMLRDVRAREAEDDWL
jgi:hypothetical protein